MADLELDAAARAAHSDAVPIYARAQSDGATVIYRSADDEELLSAASIRDALEQAREAGHVSDKRAVIRSDGEPDGQWRWLDASAVEDEAIGQDDQASRIGPDAIWEMAASLNSRRTAVPINGGPTEDGYAESKAHGDAAEGGDHPANGWAHIGVPVVNDEGRTHLFLHGELIESVAKEVDRGRLAFGSVYFGYAEADPADDFAVHGAQLISHALTNDPAVTTLTAGSERARSRGGLPFYHRARWRETMTMPKTIPAKRSAPETIRIDDVIATMHDETKPREERARAAQQLAVAARGPVGDAYNRAAEAFGIDAAELAQNPWAVEDACFLFRAGMQAEARVEASAPPPAADSDGRAARAVEGLAGENLDAFAQAILDEVRKENPDATPEDVLAMVADKFGGSGDAEDEAAMADDGEETADDTERMEDGEDEEEEIPKVAASSSTRALQRRVDKFEARDFVNAEIDKRKLGERVSKEDRTRYVDIAMRKGGRDIVVSFLDQLNKPPTGNPLEGAWRERSGARTAVQPKHWRHAVDLCMETARAQLEAEEKHLAEELHRPERTIPRHVVRGRAQQLAAEMHPELNPSRGAA